MAAAGGVNPELLEDFAQAFTRDVEVTRRLYRSGDSEYLIDGQVCRLRDVHELLMDTGLGAKAYSIIEQGKIGMILSSRPADRRQLIEEAAGITKYKSRRRSAELKLEAAQQNLTRIDDIVFEVEKQRGTLKRQAAKARRYKRLREELRRWEKVLFARRYRELSAAIGEVRGRLDAARERETAAAARVAEFENRSRPRAAGPDLRGRARRAAARGRPRARAAGRRCASSSSTSTGSRRRRSRRAAPRSATRSRSSRRAVSPRGSRSRPAALATAEAEASRDAAAAQLAAAGDEHTQAHMRRRGPRGRRRVGPHAGLRRRQRHRLD